MVQAFARRHPRGGIGGRTRCWSARAITTTARRSPGCGARKGCGSRPDGASASGWAPEQPSGPAQPEQINEVWALD